MYGVSSMTFGVALFVMFDLMDGCTLMQLESRHLEWRDCYGVMESEFGRLLFRLDKTSGTLYARGLL
ncbi:hypothetical protein GOP47_0003632 [Adiantum capillus-veneris]|uniref:Uncharacterized protein n=1 Tax=Adiantum capillus-veneris TaxID=13818 RepID=A0A9D4V6H4_ADICA|nr:hypothetical protein GOP47_0003632 [Adiantum capillus-veneris]